MAVSLAPYEEQLWRFRQQLFGWFVGLMVLLLLTLAALLRWVLAPLRRLEREIHAVEEGRSDTLGQRLPARAERASPTNLNALLVGERKRVARYRDTLGNLAHSLKTPLAVMRSSLPAVPPAPAAPLGAEIDRMSGIIEHQLKRAAASGGALLGQAPVEVAQVAARSARRAAEGLRAQGSVDRAGGGAGRRSSSAIAATSWSCWATCSITPASGAAAACGSASRVDAGAGPRERLSLVVEDDGPGISAEDRARVLRARRAGR